MPIKYAERRQAGKTERAACDDGANDNADATFGQIAATGRYAGKMAGTGSRP